MRTDGPWRRPLAWLEPRAKGVHHFLTADGGRTRLLREVSSIVLLVVVMLGSLWGYTGQEFPSQSPVVVVESGSMMHCANGVDVGPHRGTTCRSSRFGRLGTIDPGDLVLVKKIDGAEDIHPLAEGGKTRYGKDGDVIVYMPHGDAGRTPIIHRALFWMEVHTDRTISIPAAGIERAQDLNGSTLRSLGVGEIDAGLVASGKGFLYELQEDCKGHSGYVTRGDNNHHVDVGMGSSSIGGACLVQPEWVVGKARGEIPWIGTLKLFLTDQDNYGKAPGDIKAFMWGTVALFVVGPFLVDRAVYAIREARGKNKGGAEDTPDEDAPQTGSRRRK